MADDKSYITEARAWFDARHINFMVVDVLALELATEFTRIASEATRVAVPIEYDAEIRRLKEERDLARSAVAAGVRQQRRLEVALRWLLDQRPPGGFYTTFAAKIADASEAYVPEDVRQTAASLSSSKDTP